MISHAGRAVTARPRRSGYVPDCGRKVELHR